MELLCHLVRETHTMRGRFVWVLLLEESRDMLEGGCPGADPRPDLHNVYVFNVRTAIPDSQVCVTHLELNLTCRSPNISNHIVGV